MKIVLTAIIGIILGAGVVFGLQHRGYLSAPFNAAPATAAANAKTERKILYWTDTMIPGFKSDKPGLSPMGMEMTPVYADDADSSNDVTMVKVSSAMAANLGVRTAPVTRGVLSRQINTVGYIMYDESRMSHVHVRTEGWIKHLRVRYEGARVKKDEPLFDLYSPSMLNAQREYLQALQNGRKELVVGAAERLRTLGVADTQIRQLASTRQEDPLVTVYAPQDASLASLGIREGMYVKPETELMTLVDVSSMWLQAEMFERQADAVKVGDTAEARFSIVPERVWKGVVEFISPSLDPQTRTLTARLRFDNADQVLKPNMLANVRLLGAAKAASLAVPREAVIRTGQGDRVILALGEGRFQPRNVVTGIESGDRVEIVSGIAEGDSVVTSSQFLMDSESSLQATFARMAEPLPDEAALPK